MKRIFYQLSLIVLILIFNSKAKAETADSLVKLSLEALPSLEKIDAWALERSGLDPQNIQQWRRGVKWSAALPRLQVGWESKASDQNTNVIQDSISVTTSGITVGPEANRIDQDFGNDRNFDVRAIWSLQEVLFNPIQIDISREARDLYLVRSRLLEETHRYYYEFKSQWIQAKKQPELLQDPLERLKLESAFDRLNSLTGGELKRNFEMTERSSS